MAPPDHVSEPDIAADLKRPQAYPSPTPAVVSVYSTHAAWVFLAGTEAWKVRKPVNFGFLDFTSAEKRQGFCEEEIRLGVRLAPDVYRGVVPVYLGPNGYSFVGPGRVVDHAVRMRRLLDEDSAASLLARHALLPEHLRTLARQLADFYSSAPETPTFGTPALFSSNLSENWEGMRPYLDRLVSGNEVAALYHWQEGQIFSLDALLHERQATGHIREGHGDLRLEHVYFPPQLEGRSLVIDPIEFNSRFRCLDVALDAAFLAMDLEAAGHPDLGSFFMSQFARATNDYDFYPLLDLYISYRAWVRAKVACFVAADPCTAPDKSDRKVKEANRLIRLALSFSLLRRTKPAVIAIGGPIGVGKSTLSDALNLALQFPTISSDATRKGLGGIRAMDQAPVSLYTAEQTRQTYREMASRAQSVIASGRGVILDGTFASPEQRKVAEDLARNNCRPFLFVELTGNEDLLRSRLRRRSSQLSESDAREEHLPTMLRSFCPAEELRCAERFVVDGGLAVSDLTARIKARLPGGVARGSQL